MATSRVASLLTHTDAVPTLWRGFSLQCDSNFCPDSTPVWRANSTMPRPRSEAWDHFIQGTNENVICKYCTKQYKKANATKMIQHLLICKMCPEEEKSKVSSGRQSLGSVQESSRCLVDEDEIDEPEEESFNVKLESDPLPSEHQAEPSQPQAGSSQPVNEKQSLIDIALARAIYGTNCSFDMTENRAWLQAFSSLSPDYKPPSAHQIHTELLDAEYLRVKSEINQSITDATSLTLLTDGFLQIKGKQVINFILTTPEPLFIKMTQTDGNETLKKLCSEITSVITEVGAHKVIAVVTDVQNNNTFMAAWQNISKMYPHISYFCCLSEAMNLIIEKMGTLKPISDVLAQVARVVKCIKNNEMSAFEKAQRQQGICKKLKLPSSGKKNNLVLALENYVKNKKVLTMMAATKRKMQSDVRDILLNSFEWSHVEEVLSILAPVSAALNNSRTNEVKISDVPMIFSKLISSIEESLGSTVLLREDEKQIIRSSVMDSRNRCVQDIHLAAHLLDAKYLGSELIDDEMAAATNYIGNFATLLSQDVGVTMANVAHFKTKTGFFGKCTSAWSAAQLVEPHIWWKSFASKEPLFPIAVRILTVPPSTAVCKRVGHILRSTKVPVTLAPERLDKLLAVRVNLSLKHDKWEPNADSSDEDDDGYDMEFVGMSDENDSDDD